MLNRVILVLTHVPVAEIMAKGGVPSLLLDRDRAKACRYAVICRDAEGQDDHGHAFMVATIKDVLPSADTEGGWLILLNRCVIGDFGSQWDGRNPVAYNPASEYATGYDGIEFAALPFRPIPKPAPLPLMASTGTSCR